MQNRFELEVELQDLQPIHIKCLCSVQRGQADSEVQADAREWLFLEDRQFYDSKKEKPLHLLNSPQKRSNIFFAVFPLSIGPKLWIGQMLIIFVFFYYQKTWFREKSIGSKHQRYWLWLPVPVCLSSKCEINRRSSGWWEAQSCRAFLRALICKSKTLRMTDPF